MIDQLFGQLKELTEKMILPECSYISFLEERRILQLCPQVAQRLLAKTLCKNETKRDYFSQTTILSQTYSLCQQLQADLALNNHKYMAHQLALLYQCMSGIGEFANPYRNRIKEMFNKIKTTLENQELPTLTVQQKNWLIELTADITAHMSRFPESITCSLTPYNTLKLSSEN
eukprot:TRINITY_DN1425_c0_g1_i1.p1 TRINITY_DN1425_c0_g1~~TRINITY_DN1425_c0_g1_i1.p1  ORF type:complete len:173 (+),score=21.11 TRINITY_DN1425_c0_g1_i1:331-849(+)